MNGRVPLAVFPFIAIGGTASAADNKLTPQQEKVLREGSDPSKGQYTSVARSDYENSRAAPTERFQVTPTVTGTSNSTSFNQDTPTKPGSSNSTSVSKTNVNPTLTGSNSYTSYNKNEQDKSYHSSFGRYFDKDFWSRPLDESSALLGTYVRQVNREVHAHPLRAEHQFSALAGEDLEDRGPESSLMKRVTDKVGEYLPHTDKREFNTYPPRDYSKTDMKEKAVEIKDKGMEKMEEMKDKTKEKMTDMKEKAVEVKDRSADKMIDMKDKAADSAYHLKEKSKEVAEDIKEKMPSTHDMKEKVVEVKEKGMEKMEEMKEKAVDLGASLKNKVSEYIPSSLSSISDTVKSVVGGSENTEDRVPGDPERLKTRLGEEAANLLQSHSPINDFKTHTATARLFADDPKRQIFTHKYTSHINEDVMQTLLMDSDKSGAKLVGIEYCISDRVYKQLPDEEKRFWYSHSFETKSGLEIAPRMPASMENKLMSDLAPTWGKAIGLWQVDKDLLPIGFPKLLAPPASDKMLSSSMYAEREKLGPVKDRQLKVPTQISASEASWDKKGATFTPEYKK